MAEDSDSAAAQVVGDGLARDIARKVDAAFFGDTTTNGPDGLGSLTHVQRVDTAGAITNTDPFAEELSLAETVGAGLTAFAVNPVDVLALSKVKKATGSNEPLLTTDASQPTKRTVLGVPLVVSTSVEAGTIWGIPQPHTFTVMREDTTLAVDYSACFSSDRVGVRATMRIGFGFPHQSAIVKISAA